MSTPAVADRPEQLTPEWLTAALRSEGHDVTVVGVVHAPVGTGQMGESYRLGLTFEGDPGALPASLIAKLPTPDLGLRPMVGGAYRAELSFYRDLAPGLPVRVPKTYFMAAADDHTSFVLLMEDLAPRRQGDQILGCTPEAATFAVRNLAGLHAGSWCDPSILDLDWLTATDQEGAAMLGEIFVGATDIFLDTFGERLAADDIALLREIPPVVAAWAVGRGERFSLIHGDYRLDNLMFPEADSADVVAVDWQTLSIGLPARDLAFVLETGMDPGPRQAHEAELVAAYHQALVDGGVEDYSFDLCFEDYRFGALQGPLITVLGAAYGARTDRGDEMFLAMAARSCQAVRDLRTLDLV